MRRHIPYPLALGVISVLVLCLLPHGGAQAILDDRIDALVLSVDGSAPLEATPATKPSGDAAIVVDFEAVLSVPPELREPIEGAMRSAGSLLPAVNRFTLTALRNWKDWMHAVLVPSYVIELGWEIELGSDEIVEVLAQRSDTGEFVAYVRGSADFTDLAHDAPADFIDYSSPLEVSPLSVDYLFPWTGGQDWYKTWGWHSGNAIDFQPVVRTTPVVDYVVLSAAAGRLTEVCNDGHQSMLRIEHAGGDTQYLHLDAGSVRRDLLGQNIVRGQIIGILYDGHEGGREHNGTHYKYWTACGYGTAAHLHFVLPRRDMAIDGHNANTVANSARATRYRSSNPRVDGGGSSQNCADGEGVVLYEHSDFQGQCTRFTGDDNYVGDNPIGNDAASSIRVIGNFEAILYEHGDYGGTSSTFTGDDPDLSNDPIGNDRASSIRVRRRDAGGSSNCDGGEGVYLYEHSNHAGRCSKFAGDAPNPRNWYIGNDSASSIRIVGSYEAIVYEHDDYNGASSAFSDDDPEFGNDTIGHDRASSIRVRRRDADGSSNCDGEEGVYLYEHGDYGGRCSKFTADAPNPRDWYIGNDTASSIRLVGDYEAAVYEHDDYNGVSSTFTGDDSDFGGSSIGHDRASSIRVRRGATGPTSCDNDQFLAEHFANRDLSGSPTFRSCVSEVNENWASNGPGNGVGDDDFSVRWSGDFWLDEGVYHFTTRTDDGVRLWIDGELLLDQWRDMGATEFAVERSVSSGLHTLRVEYYEHGGYATARLSWQRQESAADPDDGRTIGFDFGLDGTVNPTGDRDDYHFEGSAGQVVTVRMDKRDSNLDSYIGLYSPDGSLLGQDDDGADGVNSRLSIELQQNGRHKIIAHGYGDSTGGYRLTITRESTSDADDNRWISFGDSLEGTVTPNDDRDWYFFSGIAGRVIGIRMDKIDSGLDSLLELYDSSGNMIAHNDDGSSDRNAMLVHALPHSGVYRILARSWSIESSGRYNLSLHTADNTNLARGKGAWATSTGFNGVEAYRAFDGDISTRWSSQSSDPQFIYVDLGSVQTFDQVVLVWERAFARRYGVYYWTGSGWQDIYWTSSGNGGNDAVAFAPVQARYVGMYGAARGTGSGYSLWEFGVYNTAHTVIPIVPPDPGDKPPEEGIDPLVPLPPNEPGKPTLLIGSGPSGQEDTPLPELADAAPSFGIGNSIPTANMLYPCPTCPSVQDGVILFQGVGEDNDENGMSIVGYHWTSSLDGELAATDMFTLPETALTVGTHIITFQVLDNEGDWSEPVTAKLHTGRRVFLPLISRR